MKLFNILILISILFFSCSKKELIFISPENQEFAKNTNEIESVINPILHKQDASESVSKISSIDYFGDKLKMYAIVHYSTNKTQVKEIAILRNYNSNGELLKEIVLECKGTCANGSKCGLYFPPSQDYLECNCTECQMIIHSSSRSPIPDEKTAGYDVYKIAKKSFEETFKEVEIGELLITKVTIEQSEKADFRLFEYTDSKNRTSSFMILKPKIDGLVANGNRLTIDKEVVVDCTGTCDCRERYIPASGAIECTCSPCSMKVTTITP